MKIRQIADAAIVAALLLTSMPELDSAITPEALLNPAPIAAHAEEPEDPATRQPSTYIAD